LQELLLPTAFVIPGSRFMFLPSSLREFAPHVEQIKAASAEWLFQTASADAVTPGRASRTHVTCRQAFGQAVAGQVAVVCPSPAQRAAASLSDHFW